MSAQRWGLWSVLASLTLAACAPGAVAPVEGPVPTVPPPVPTPAPEVPVTNAFAAAVERGTRTETGAPGPNYWQNYASYRIAAELDPATALLRGSATIVYRNDSPTTLLSVVLNLYQNIFSPTVPRNRYAPNTGGVTLERVTAQGQTLAARATNEIPISVDVREAPAGYAVQGTLARVRLPRPVGPGESVTLEIDWRQTVPPATSFRTAYEDALGSRAFLIAQWYPQIAMYDDLRGWDATPYLGDGEFYLGYADFDVSITVPDGVLVGATGELANPEEVLTDEARRRLDRALETDSITRVVTDADLTAENATQPSIDGQLTWRFTAQNVRDFAFAASDGYVWDATRAQVGEGADQRWVTIHSLYRPGAPNWEQAARYGEHSIAFFSDQIAPYPYPQMTIAEGPITGMEYPMITFIYRPNSELALYSVIAHEVAHEWFPMVVGTDEAAYAWMDEGAATWMEAYAMEDFFDLENPFGGDIGNYLSVAGSDAEVPLMRHTDLVSPYGARTVAAYSKPAVLLRSLEGILGPERFGAALRTFFDEWAYRHPTPWDFFNTVERVAGEPLDWFFVPWWFETAALDQAIAEVAPGAGGTTVTVERLGDAVAPTPVVGVTASGELVRGTIPAATWLAGARTATVVLPGSAPLTRIVIDPEQLYPDVDLENNVWEATQ